MNQSPKSPPLSTVLSRVGRAAMLTLLVGLSAVAGRSIYAQNDNQSLPGSSFEISGQVRVSQGRAALQFVSVRLDQAGGSLVDQRTTDSIGNFRFSRLAPGSYVVSAQFSGFRATPQTVELSRSNPRAYLLLELKADTDAFGRPNEAKAEVVDARVPEAARIELNKARESLARKQTDAGIAHLEKAISIFPEFFDARMLIGTTQMDLGRLDQAEAAFRSSLKSDPRSVSAMVSLGEVLRRQKKYSESKAFLIQALAIQEDSWVGHYTLGRVYWETDEIANAGRQIGRSIQLQPDFPEAHLLGGNIFMKLGMGENALVEYEEYLRLAPKGQQATPTRELVRKLTEARPIKKQ